MLRAMRFLFLFLCCSWSLGAIGAENEPRAIVEGLQLALIEVMKDASTLGYQGRYERLEPAILESHDIGFIAKTAAGRHWSKLTEAERQAFVNAFTRLTVATYADRFDGYGGEKFGVSQQEPLSNGQTVVHGMLTKGDGSTVRFDYVMRETEGQWRIVNIVVDGVSDLALKRAEYGTIIGSSGIRALIGQLENRIASYVAAN
jgi:phospholipid transport system substrate-binding protein